MFAPEDDQPDRANPEPVADEDALGNPYDDFDGSQDPEAVDQ